jgi:RNA polymerase sigma-70 factor (ECF subfamily)
MSADKPPPATHAGPRGKDRARLEELLTPLLGPAYGFCLRLTRSQADAEDLVQEAALNAWKGFESFEPGTNFKAWFFKIIVNTLRSRFRRKRPEDRSVAFEDASELYLYRHTEKLGWHREGSDPARELLDRLGTAEIDRALAELPEKYRMVCTMYFIEDFSYEDIAKMLGLPVGTVRSRLHRGRKLLQQSLWRAAVEQGIVPRPAGESGAGRGSP